MPLQNRNLGVTFFILAVAYSQGCGPQPESFLVFEVYSDYHDSIRILECDGLDEAQPSGVISPTKDNIPSATLVFPEASGTPTDFTTRWINLRTHEEHQQSMKFPKVPPGASGVIECRLSKENRWSWTFRPRR
jgi:hypothetical protein